MPDGKKVRYNLVDRIAPVAHDIIDFLKSAIAANKGRWFTERGSEYAIPQDQEGWNKLPDSEKRVILDTFRTHGQYSRADDSITTTHQVAHDHSIAGEEVFHALSRRLKDADRDTYNRMMTKYDSEDAAFHDFQTSKSRAEYFKRIREGTAHESPSARAGDKYLSPKQKAEATLLSAAQDAGVLMSEHEFESFVNDRGGLHPDVLDEYKLRDANGKPRLNGDGEQMYTKEGNILKNFVNEGAHSDIAKDLSPAESDRYQQRIVNELLMTKAEKVRMAAEQFQSNPYAHPELKEAADKILGKQETPAEDNEPAPFATRRFEAGKKLDPEEKKKVLDSVGDVYRDNRVAKEYKGLDSRGEEIYGYPYAPEHFLKSDITGKPIRNYITLPDGRKAHPSELYPNISKADVDRTIGEREMRERNDAAELKRFDKAAVESPQAAKASFVRRNWSNLRSISENEAIADRGLTLEKGGKFYTTISGDTAEMAKKNGWRDVNAPASESTEKTTSPQQSLSEGDTESARTPLTGSQKGMLGSPDEASPVEGKQQAMFGRIGGGPRGKSELELPPEKTAIEKKFQNAPTAKLFEREPERSGDQGSLFAVRRSAEAAGASKDEIEDARKQWAEKGTESPYFKKWFGESKTVDADGKPKVMYHGTSRPDRIGDKFRADRATSGPMQYFTDDPGIGSNYSTGKADTSLEQPADYADWFKFKPKGSRSEVNIEQAWHHLSAEERASIAEKLPHVTSFDKDNNESGTIRLGDSDEYGLAGKDHWAYEIQQARGNVLKAAKEIWLNSGNLVGSEHEFLDVLDKAGMKGVRLDDPQAQHSAVFPTYLSIKNPLVTSDIPQDVMNALDVASRRTRAKVAPYGADQWDKNTRNPGEWMRQLKEDYAKKENSFVWTSVPDWATKTLREKGYDGIQDTGGKMGGQGHNVWVPFDPEQIKSATGNRGTFDENNANINFATRRRTESEQSEIPKEQEKPEDQDTRPDPTLFGQYDKGPTSTKNEVVDRERESRGLPAAMKTVRRELGEVWDSAMKEIDRNPEKQDDLIQELKAKPRALTDRENALLLHRQVDLQNQYAQNASDLIDAKAKGDDAAATSARIREAALSDKLLELYNVNKASGSETGRGLNARRMMANEDYSLAAMETRKRAVNGGRELSQAESDHIKELHGKIAEMQKKYDDYVKNNENRARRVRSKDATSKIIAEASTRRDPLPAIKAKRESILAGLRQRVSSLRDSMGSGQFAVRGEGEESEPASAHAQDEGVVSDWSHVPNLHRDIQELAKTFVQEGVRDRDTLVDRVHGELKEILRGFSKDDTIDAISGYGKFKPLSKDEISVTLRDLKGQLQQEAKLRDMTEKGLAPLKTGIERRAPSDEERRLIQQVNDTRKKLGISATDPETELKGALDGVKTRLKNQISDLDYQIARGEKTVREKSPSPTDAEADALRTKRDDLKKQYDAMFADPKISDEDRIKVAMRSAEKSLATYEQRVKDNLPFDAKKPVAPTSPELDAVRARRDAAKDELEHLQSVAGVDAVNARKQKIAEKQIAEVERKIREKELVASKAPTQSTPELDALNAHRNVLQKTLDKIRSDATKKPQSQIDAEKQAKRIQQLQESIANIGQKIADKTPAEKQTKTVESPEIEALKKQRSLMAQSLMKIRNEARPRKTPEEIALKAFKTRTTNRIAELTEKLAKKDYATAPPRPKLQLDPDGLKLEAERNRLQNKFKVELMRDRMKNRSIPEKIMDGVATWARVGALSWPTVFQKLTGAAISRVITTPVEQAVGYGASKVFPRLAEKASTEGVPSAKGAIIAEGRAMARMFTDGIKGSGKLLSNKETDLQAVHGDEPIDHPWHAYLGKIHEAFKNPVFEGDYARRLELLYQHTARNGENVNDPQVKFRLSNEAYTAAKGSIFKQDNGLVNMFNAGISRADRIDPATGQKSMGMKLIATVAKAEMPIVKVPSNVIAEASNILTGWLHGPARAAWAYAHGIENLKPAQADSIMRAMKKGLPGLALLLVGFYKHQQVGGFYQAGKKRDDDDVPVESVRVGDTTIDKGWLHGSYASVLQFGATVGRLAEKLVDKGEDDAEGYASVAGAAATGLLEQTPFARETSTLAKYMDPRTQGSAVSSKLSSLVTPGLVQWIARQMDKDEKGNTVPRKPTGVFENLESGIPLLRQNVPTDEKKARELANR